MLATRRECEQCPRDVEPLFCVGGSWYYRCASCGLVQLSADVDETSVAQVYDDSYFTSGGAGYPNYLEVSQLLREQGRRYARILATFMNPGRLLDDGGAAGFIAQGFRDLGWSTTVLEPNRSMAAVALSHGVEVHVGTLESYEPTAPFDAIAMIQVIAHFFDLHMALQGAARATHVNSYVLVETWNAESLMARILGSQWHGYAAPSVRRVFTPASLDRAFKAYGFLRVAFGRPQKWISGFHAKSLLAYLSSRGGVTRLASAVARIIPDNVSIPYPGEDLFWALYVKSDGSGGAPR
jgi:hypothetical protein